MDDGPRSVQDEAIQSVIRDAPTKTLHSSPAAWEDEVIYFMLPDRFSDGNENGFKDIDGNIVKTGETPLYTPAAKGNAIKTKADEKKWLDAGTRFTGGTIRGLQSKLGYLKRMGITAIWVGPVFKQVSNLQTYYGYGETVKATQERPKLMQHIYSNTELS